MAKTTLQKGSSADWLNELIDSREAGRPLDRLFYISPELFAREMELIFLRYWLFVGHVNRIPNPGDYFLYQIAEESIILTRGEQGQIHALFNVCRHRGSRVLLESQGQAKCLVCPYHAWVYRLDGSLLHARHMLADFDKADYGLMRGHVEILEGMIFVHFGQQPDDFSRIRVEIEPFLKPHGWPEAKVAKRSTYLCKANWKIVAENAMECYHCGPAHPEFASVMSYVGAIDSPKLAEERKQLTCEWEAQCESIGHKTGEVLMRPDTWWQIRRLPIRRGYLTQSEGGKPVAPLMEDFRTYDGGVTGLGLLPMNFMVGTPDHGALIRFTPLEPLLTEVEITWLVHKDAVEGRDYDPDKVSWVWRVTGEADVRICENNQLGVMSSRYRPGLYSKPEDGVEDFIKWYLRRVRNNFSPQP
jgi:Rieske 2Fe-2S family protein